MKTKKGAPRSVFYDLHPQEKAAELEFRANLMLAITKEIRRRKLTQAAAGKILDVPQTRVSDMFNSKLSKFGLGMLYVMALKIGIEVKTKITSPKGKVKTSVKTTQATAIKASGATRTKPLAPRGNRPTTVRVTGAKKSSVRRRQEKAA